MTSNDAERGSTPLTKVPNSQSDQRDFTCSMGQIQSNIGVITGFPIVDTVDQLMAISARPRDLAVARREDFTSEQMAITQLTSLLVNFQGAVNTLSDTTIFEAKKVTSSNESLLTAAVSSSGTPTDGSYLLTPVRQARGQQFLSRSMVDKEQPLGIGTLTLQDGGFLDRGLNLATLNEGTGVARGWVRVTDGTGARTIIDLRFAQTVDDVIETFNSNTTVNVTIAADRDRFRLTDHTGSTTSHLKVEEVGGGSTAADLGLASIDLDLAMVTDVGGQNVVQLYDGLALSQLNDGNGVYVNDGVDDLRVSFRDGSADLDIDLTTESTLGEVLQTLNAADPTRLTAQISVDRLHIELSDLTTGGNTFTVASLYGGTTAENLGIATSDVDADGVITSSRLHAGLKDVLLHSLKGGSGLGTLGTLDLTDRSGVNTTVDLSSAETLQEIIRTINHATNDMEVSIAVRVNDAGNGIVLLDTSGGSGNLTVANGDINNTADVLGITVNATQNSVNGGTLNLKTVSRATPLALLNNEQGVEAGSFIITDSDGVEAAIKLDDENDPITTVGKLVDAINAKSIAVDAQMNDTGDGIVLIDRAGGFGELSVREVNGDTAADLGILGTATTQQVGIETVEALNGSSRVTVAIDADDTLDDLVKSINDADSRVNAALVFDGSGYRLSVVSKESGPQGEVLIDASHTGLALQEMVQAKDALLAFGPPGLAGSSILISSPSNRLSSFVDGLDITLESAADEVVTIDVEASEDSLVEAVDVFIDAYNAVVDHIDSATFFNDVENTTGVLFGSSEVLRVESEIANLATSSFYGLGDFQSLEQVGIEINDQGKLSLDREKLSQALLDDPEALRTFFSKEAEALDPAVGVFGKFDALIESLAGSDNSLLANRSETLAKKIENTNDRIKLLNTRLDTERILLLNRFIQMESIVAQLQHSLSALNSLSMVASRTNASLSSLLV